MCGTRSRRAALEETGDGDYARATANDRFVIPGRGALERRAHGGQGWGAGDPRRHAPSKRPTPTGSDGIFGDAPWTNKVACLTPRQEPTEHFSKHHASLAQVPEDELGVAYEFRSRSLLTTAATWRRSSTPTAMVVHLMVQMLDPQPGEGVL